MISTYSSINPVRLLFTFCCRCHYYLPFALILTGFQVKSQPDANLEKSLNKNAIHDNDSAYYELFKLTYRANIEKAKYYAQKAFQISSKKKHLLMQAKACRALAHTYNKNNQFDSAKWYFRNGIKISSINNFTEQLINLYNDAGLLFERIDVYDSALHYFTLSYNLARKNKSYQYQAIACSNLGLVYSYLENFHEALVHYKQAVQLANNNEIPKGFNLNLNLINLARVLNEQGLYNDAIEQLQKVKENCNNGCDDNTLTGLNYGLGYANLKKGDYNIAHAYFVKAFALAKKCGDSQWLSNTLYHLSSFSIAKKNYIEGINYLHEVEKISNAISHKRLLRDTYKQLAIIYDKYGDIDKARKYEKLYGSLKDSLFNKKVASNITQIRLTEQHRHSQEIIRKKDLTLKEKIEDLWNANLLAIILFTDCIIAIIIIYFAYRKIASVKKRKKSLEHELMFMLNTHQIDQREIRNEQLQFNYLLSRVSEFLSGPVNSLVDLSKLYSQNSTPEQNAEYVAKMRTICLTEIMGILKNIMKLCGISNKGILTEEIDVSNVVAKVHQEFKRHTHFPLLNFNIDKSVTNVLSTDESHLVTLLKNAILYFVRSTEILPIEIRFMQNESATIITVKNRTDTTRQIAREKLFNLFTAQILTLKLRGDTVLAEREEFSSLTIIIPTEYAMSEHKPMQETITVPS